MRELGLVLSTKKGKQNYKDELKNFSLHISLFLCPLLSLPLPISLPLPVTLSLFLSLSLSLSLSPSLPLSSLPLPLYLILMVELFAVHSAGQEKPEVVLQLEWDIVHQ